MAVTFKVRIGNLFAEFLADALIILGSLQTTGAISASALQSFTDAVHHILIFVKTYSQINHIPSNVL